MESILRRMVLAVQGQKVAPALYKLLMIEDCMLCNSFVVLFT